MSLDSQTQTVSVNTTLAAGQHTVTVDFLNDAYGGTSTTDRNLYLDNAMLNGQTIAGSSLALFCQGPKSFGVPVSSQSSLISRPSAVVLDISEDAWLGDAQFAVTIDGQPQDGVMTAHASHGAGQTEAVSFDPILTDGYHTMAISFLNDAYGGTADTDRNLYLDSATLNGTTVPGSSASLFCQGTYTFNMLVSST